MVYIQDKNGVPLMPTNRNRAVRHWLRSGRAIVVNREPFTIKLTNRVGGYLQPLEAGVDLGTIHVGVSVVSEVKEVFAGEFMLRKDISELLATRRMFRRNRRNRKTRYRKPRFLNRKKQDKLAPSIRAKIDETHKILRLIKSILPISHWTFEVGNFDIQKINTPEIKGVEYQQGEQYGYANVREYVLHRDKHTCQACKGKSKDPVLHVHHSVSRKTGGDKPANLITLCSTCHWNHHNVKPLILKAPKSQRDATQFSIIKKYIVNETEDLNRSVTYGYITKVKRQELGIEKSHINDAFVIAGGLYQERIETQYLGVFKRKQNRKLFKGFRSHIKNTIPSAFGFRRGDRVKFEEGREGFIFALRSSGYFDVRQLDDTVLSKGVSYKKIIRLESVKTLSIEKQLLLPKLKFWVSVA
jgi:hypothetical protein